MKISKSFMNQAIWTWKHLSMEADTGIAVGEETFTDINLIQLKKAHPYQLHIKKFSKPAESENGSDWEWWFVSGDLGLGMRIQAKRIKGEKYAKMHYKNGMQYELLLAEAMSNSPKLIPMYVFYNYFNPETISIPWNCCKDSIQDLEKLGCSIVLAEQIDKSKLEKFGIDDVKDIMLPWSCLTHCDCLTQEEKKQKQTSLPFKTYSLITKKLAKNKNIDGDRDKFITNDLPKYVTDIIAGKENIEISNNKIGLAGVMVIREK